MHLGTGLIEASNAMMVAPQSPNWASMFSICFLENFFDSDLLMDLRDGINNVTLYNACDDEIDMVGIGRILDIAPHRPHSAFNLFRVSIFETNGATLYDACTNKMDMIGRCRILDVAPHNPGFSFDMFEVLMLEMDDDDFVTDVTHDAIAVEGVSNSVDPPLSFDTLSGFVTHYDGMSTEYHNDMRIFEYSPMSLHFPVITSPTPTA